MRTMLLGDILNIMKDAPHIDYSYWNKWQGPYTEPNGWAWTELDTIDGKSRWQIYLDALCKELV